MGNALIHVCTAVQCNPVMAHVIYIDFLISAVIDHDQRSYYMLKKTENEHSAICTQKTYTTSMW